MTLRSQESIVEREVRMSADRERHALSRESETFTERESRLSSQRTRTMTLRSQESVADREVRLSADRERHALSRESESLSQREERLQIARHHYVGVQRNNENYLASERERIDELRRTETVEQRQSRLEIERARYHINRDTNSDADESMQYDDFFRTKINIFKFVIIIGISYQSRMCRDDNNNVLCLGHAPDLTVSTVRRPGQFSHASPCQG
ncbi:hypothetical protein HF086_016502 [Spodoptera exigua]|uniref:Uncharacterized protein n=1 Tax=Spodoptera exigua TaxID=7107 RepID=A0A922SMK5_SPOEX|nr:hypothetical protein HF086_016502 [Spodoptera exigua]